MAAVPSIADLHRFYDYPFDKELEDVGADRRLKGLDELSLVSYIIQLRDHIPRMVTEIVPYKKEWEEAKKNGAVPGNSGGKWYDYIQIHRRIHNEIADLHECYKLQAEMN